MKVVSASKAAKELARLRLLHTGGSETEEYITAAALLEDGAPDHFPQILENAKIGNWEQAEALWKQALELIKLQNKVG